MTEKEIQLGELWIDKLQDNKEHIFVDLLKEFSEDDQRLAEEVLSWLIYYKYVENWYVYATKNWILKLNNNWANSYCWRQKR